MASFEISNRGAGGDTGEDAGRNKKNILIMGHGLIDSNKFIIVPEHIDLTFYTEKGKVLFRNFTKNIVSEIKLKGNPEHYIQEKTLLNDMKISFNNIFQKHYRNTLFLNVSHIENTQIINHSGIITEENIISIDELSNEIYERYGIRKNTERFINIDLEVIEQNYNFDKNFLIHSYRILLKNLNDLLLKRNLINKTHHIYKRINELLSKNNFNQIHSILKFKYLMKLNLFLTELINTYITDETIKNELNITKLHIDESYKIIQNLYSLLINDLLTKERSIQKINEFYEIINQKSITPFLK